jgi:hypothetical protein
MNSLTCNRWKSEASIEYVQMKKGKVVAMVQVWQNQSGCGHGAGLAEPVRLWLWCRPGRTDPVVAMVQAWQNQSGSGCGAGPAEPVRLVRPWPDQYLGKS